MESALSCPKNFTLTQAFLERLEQLHPATAKNLTSEGRAELANLIKLHVSLGFRV